MFPEPVSPDLGTFFLPGTSKKERVIREVELEKLKELGFSWNPKHKKWSFAGKKSQGWSRKSINHIRKKYGSQSVKNEKGEQAESKKIGNEKIITLASIPTYKVMPIGVIFSICHRSRDH